MDFDESHVLAVRSIGDNYPIINMIVSEKLPCLNFKDNYKEIQTSNKFKTNDTKFKLEKAQIVSECKEKLNHVNQDHRYREIEGAPKIKEENFYSDNRVLERLENNILNNGEKFYDEHTNVELQLWSRQNYFWKGYCQQNIGLTRDIAI